MVLSAGCADYRLKNLAKSDVDLVADEFIQESRLLVLELMEKLYKRNPTEIEKNPGMTVSLRQRQLQASRERLSFSELSGSQGIDALNLAFDPSFRGDRVFALTVGLGTMLRQAYGFKAEMFIYDQLNGPALVASARNVEVLAWKLKNSLWSDGSYYLVSHENNGVVDNLSFERLFGKLIVLQDMMARIANDSDHRAITATVHTVSRVFIPLPI